jgi:hypothetical protein
MVSVGTGGTYTLYYLENTSRTISQVATSPLIPLRFISGVQNDNMELYFLFGITTFMAYSRVAGVIQELTPVDPVPFSDAFTGSSPLGLEVLKFPGGNDITSGKIISVKSLSPL